MAAAAYVRAHRFRMGGEPVIGLSCTAAIASDRPKWGDHRCHISLWDGVAMTTTSLTLEKEARKAYIRYLIQDGRVNQIDAAKTLSEGVQKIWRMAFETKLREKVRVWAERYYANYPHLYDSQTKRLKGYKPEVIAMHFMPIIEVRKGQRGNVEMQEVIAEMAAAADRERFDNA